jgi:hypothetical protein
MASRLKRMARHMLDNVISGGRFPLIHSMEPIYQNLVQRDLRVLGIGDDFYPVAGAASYSLFYLLIRIAKELPVKSVLELGAGETTRLLHTLANHGVLTAKCITLEHNKEWAARISQTVPHDIITTRLIERTMDGINYQGYDFSPLNLPNDIELLVVDGPPASTEGNTFARLGAVDLVERLSPNDFILILDDTHRSGEMLLIEKIEYALRRRRINFSKGQIITSKRQTIFAGGAYERVASF